MSTPIYYIKSGSLSFGDKPIFDNILFHLHKGDKISLVGKNGCGKSSLMKIIYGEYELDKGELYIDPKIRVGYLSQEFDKSSAKTIFDLVLEGLAYEDYKYKADIILMGLKLDGDADISKLSGGQKRRAFLARALTIAPDILLLDEPTNHLDINSVEWLEEFIKSYNGAIITISHDRKFLENTTNKVLWLDKGTLRISSKGFKNFFEWQEEVIKEEENELIKMNKKLAQEKIWLNQGVTARRKRNQKRLGSLKRLRDEQREFQTHLSNSKRKLQLNLEEEEKKSKFIIEADNISFCYNQKTIFKDFSIRVTKGEKIGVIGPNGSGKSTLIKVLLGLLENADGNIRRGKTLDITYFDQHREDLNSNDSLAETILPGGGDTVFLKNKTIHISGYLKQFLFDPKSINQKVSTLSGGEKNRLLLAKTLINPGNFMVLDEPTNDLDMDTLDLLLEILADYEGTLVIVSHDRDFLDKLVTRTLVFTDDNKIEDFIGGYEDYLKHNKSMNSTNIKEKKSPSEKKEKSNNSSKLSFKYIHLQKTLPIDIELLESNIKKIEAQLSDHTLYSEDNDKFISLTSKLEKDKNKLENLMEQWLEVEEHIDKFNSN